MNEPFEDFSSRVVVLPIDNIDTDQIIPARFLKTTSKVGLDKHLFQDWRYDADGSPKSDFVLNKPESKGAQVLLAGDNFGCGSSREHAPWALMQFGFRAVISTSFADIFRSNSLKNGFLPIAIPQEAHSRLFDLLAKKPDAEVSVDLANQTLTLPDGSTAEFPIDDFSKACILAGVDELGYILSQEAAIQNYEKDREIPLRTTSA
jgi:3-isopropylmalate/(R)-2-methylmalate dehydratase small subunit